MTRSRAAAIAAVAVCAGAGAARAQCGPRYAPAVDLQPSAGPLGEIAAAYALPPLGAVAHTDRLEEIRLWVRDGASVTLTRLARGRGQCFETIRIRPEAPSRDGSELVLGEPVERGLYSATRAEFERWPNWNVVRRQLDSLGVSAVRQAMPVDSAISRDPAADGGPSIPGPGEARIELAREGRYATYLVSERDRSPSAAGLYAVAAGIARLAEEGPGVVATLPPRQRTLVQPMLGAVIRGRIRIGTPGSSSGRWDIGWTRADGASARGTTDGTGSFVLGHLEPGTFVVRIRCRSERRWPIRRIAADTVVAIPAFADTTVEVPVDPRACVEPPLATRVVEVRGHFTSGFESSRLEACEEVANLAGTIYEEPGPTIWVRWTDSGGARWDVVGAGIAPEETAPPPADGSTRDGWVYPRWYVRLRGELEGPGGYGHMGLATFVLRVTDVLEVATPANGDCDPA